MVLAALVPLGSRFAIEAQTVEEYRLRVAEATAAWEEAKIAEQRAGAITGTLDTIRVGTLTLVTVPHLRERVAGEAQEAWKTIERALGSDVQLLASTTILVLPFGTRAVDVERDATWLLTVAGESVEFSARLIRAVSPTLVSLADEGVRAWLSGDIPVDGVFPVHARGVFLELATGTTHANSVCYSGDLTVCGKALGLIGVTDPVRELYPATERRELVRHTRWYHRASRQRLSECLRDGADSACLDLLHALTDHRIRLPLTVSARRHVAQVAFGTVPRHTLPLLPHDVHGLETLRHIGRLLVESDR